MLSVNRSHKILIVGDSGRGKSTLAFKLSQKFGIPQYSTDDFYWKVKFSQAEDKVVSLQSINKIFDQKSWIMEGSTRSLIAPGLVSSDIIIYLKYPNLLSQYWVLFRRKLTRTNETWINLFRLYLHLFFKKYQLGPQKNKLGLEQMLHPYQSKVITLHTFKQINVLLNTNA